MTKRLLIALATLALAPFALAACGDDEEEGTTSAAEETTEAAEEADTDASGGGGTVTFEAVPDGSFAWTESDVSAAAGEATIEMNNPSSTPHNAYIEDEGGNVLAETETVTDSSTTATATLEPGTYVFYCDISGHREGGMEGTLTVE